MPNIKSKVIPYGVTGLNLYVVPKRLSGNEMNSAGVFVAAPAADPGKVAAEDAINKGTYNFSSAEAVWTTELHYLYVYERIGAAKNRAVDNLVAVYEESVVNDQFVRLDSMANVGGMTGAHTVTVQFYRTATVTPIPDVLCDVYDSTETTRLNGTQIKSDVNGRISFSRDNGTYKIRAMLAGFTFTTGSVTVTDGNAALTMYGSAITIPLPPVAGTQTLYGNVRELNWGVATGDTVTAVIADKGQVVNGALIQYLDLSTTVDANSQFSLTVPKGAVIRLTVKDHATHTITINQENTYDVATYLTE